jgi:hypothetical protein
MYANHSPTERNGYVHGNPLSLFGNVCGRRLSASLRKMLRRHCGNHHGELSLRSASQRRVSNPRILRKHSVPFRKNRFSSRLPRRLSRHSRLSPMVSPESPTTQKVVGLSPFGVRPRGAIRSASLHERAAQPRLACGKNRKNRKKP